MRWLVCFALLCAAPWGCDDSTPTMLPDGAPPIDAAPDFPPDDGALPDAAVPDTAVPDGPLPDTQTTDGPVPDLLRSDATPDYLPWPPDQGPPDTVGWDVLTGTGADFVVSRFILPTSTTASALGVDLNNDGTVDNAFGAILGGFSSMLGDLGLQEALDQSVYSGSALQLMRIFSQGLVTDPAAVLQTWAGQSQICCTSTVLSLCLSQAQLTCFGGSHTFSPDPADPQGTVMTGSIATGAMGFSGTQMKIRLPLSVSGTLDLTIKAAQVKGQVAATGISKGIIAGGIPQYDVQAKIIPALAAQLNHALNDPLVDPSTKLTIQTLFDTNGDGSITAAETAGNTIIKTFLAGDVDVDGDGVNELSIGLGYEAVPATITP